MGYRSVCTSQAYSALAGGLALLVFPGLLLGLFGITGAQTDIVARLAGGMMLALAATLWGARDVAARGIRRIVLGGNALCDVALTATFAVAAAKGALNPRAYALAVLFLLNVLSWLAAARDRGE